MIGPRLELHSGVTTPQKMLASRQAAHCIGFSEAPQNNNVLGGLGLHGFYA